MANNSGEPPAGQPGQQPPPNPFGQWWDSHDEQTPAAGQQQPPHQRPVGPAQPPYGGTPPPQGGQPQYGPPRQVGPPGPGAPGQYGPPPPYGPPQHAGPPQPGYGVPPQQGYGVPPQQGPYGGQGSHAAPPPYQGQGGYGGQPGYGSPSNPGGPPNYGGPPFYLRQNQPPRRRRTGLIVGLSLLCVLVLVVSVTAALGGFSGGTSTAAPTPTATESSVPTSPAPSTSAPSSAPTTAPSTSAPTTKPPSPPPTRRTPPKPTAKQVVTQNKLYVTGFLPASKCKEPSQRPTSRSNVYAYYWRFLGCLNKVWAPTIRETRNAFRAPRLVVYVGRRATSPCGPASDAFYCSANETIYMSATEDMDNYRKFSKVWTRTDMAFTIAHEYGHHVQHLTGILRASRDREYDMSSRSQRLEESRRVELQASCLSAVYLGADKAYFPVSGSWATWWRWKVHNHGDQWNPERDHGDKKNHGWWSLRGFNSRNPGLCNTFTASPKMVS